jgi:protein-tyrosine phosphatase
MEDAWMSHPFDLLEIPGRAGRLIFTPCPGTRDTSLDEALTELKAAGADALVTLMPDAELAANQAADLSIRCASHGLEWIQLPVADEQAPLADFDAAWLGQRDRIVALLDSDATVAIHCKGGSGRTGLIGARILIELGLPHEAAVEQVQALRPKAIRHPAHADWLAQFES